jgi:hypothetical protein
MRNGLDMRCRQVYSLWQEQKKRDDQQLKKQESDDLSAQRRQNEATLKRIKAGTIMWLVTRALDKYP